MLDRRQALIVGLAVAICLLSAFPALAQGKAERVGFKRGHSSTTLKGRITGFGTRDYLIGAREGQLMTLRLSSSNSYTIFVIYSINGRPTDMLETTEWSQRLSESGDYLVRVLMMRAGARRKGAAADYTLSVSIR